MDVSKWSAGSRRGERRNRIVVGLGLVEDVDGALGRHLF
jgi:hypothetical protein